jgi:hypothetical protein
MEKTAEKRPVSRRRKIIEAVLLIVGSMLFVGALSSIALLIYTDGSREPTVRTIVIPEGAYELIQAGENPLEIASTESFLADDTLVLDNRDVVTHVLGNWTVPANTIRRFELQPAYGGFFVCSLHPSGAITLDIKPRDYDFKLIAAPTLGFGFAVGLIIWIGINVSRVMGAGGDGYKRDDIGDPSSGGPDDSEHASSGSLGI